MQVLQTHAATGAFAKAPHVRQHVWRDAPAVIGNTDDDVLGSLANQNIDVPHVLRGSIAPLHGGLDGVTQELADDVLKMTQNVGEGGVQMSLYSHLGEFAVGAIRLLHQCGGDRRAPLDHFLGIAAQEYLADVVRRGVTDKSSGGIRVRGIKGVSESNVLLGNNPTRYALGRELAAADAMQGRPTDLSMVVTNWSVWSGFIKSWTSMTPITRRGITVRCSFSVSRMRRQRLSLSWMERISGMRRNLSKAV
jgi:hypothetical protein